jgi:outer membrane protein assembly factor BamB
MRRAGWTLLGIGLCQALLMFGMPGEGCAATDEALARHLLDAGGFSGGVCAVLGTEDGELPLAMARAGRLLVHVVEPREEAVTRARKTCAVEGLWGKRIVVERGSQELLPYADDTIDLVVATGLTGAEVGKVKAAEVMRVLRPRGKALLGARTGTTGGVTEEELKKLFGGLKARVFSDGFGVWAEWVKPVPAGVDSWSHWQHGPDGNPVSTDTVIHAPYLLQWLGEPYYVAMPTVTLAAGGREFLATGHMALHRWEWPSLYTLIARNGYNGQVLWTRKLPDGYLVHRSAFIATDDVFYMIDGDRGVCLEAETGKEVGEIRFPGATEKWEWMAMSEGRLYVLSGTGSRVATQKALNDYDAWDWNQIRDPEYVKPGEPVSGGKTITAWDLKAKKVLWQHWEQTPVDSRGMAVGGGKVFFYGSETSVGCLDAQHGNVLWRCTDEKVAQLIEQPAEKDVVSHPGFRTTMFVLYTPEALVYLAQARNNVVAVSTADGRYLWHRKKVTRDSNLVYVGGKLVGAIGKWGNHWSADPTTGNLLEDLKFGKTGCVRLTGSPEALYVRGEGMLRYDLKTGKVTVDSAMRSGCTDGVVTANGLLYLSPWLCGCNLMLVGAGAMCSRGELRIDSVPDEPGRLEQGTGDIREVAALAVDGKDWFTYRGGKARGASTTAVVPQTVGRAWEYGVGTGVVPSATTAAGEFVFLAGEDGVVRALSAADGRERWSYLTGGAVRVPPTIWQGRAYVGSSDGWVYCLEAATGRLLWRFRAAPMERRIMVYGTLSSTWPVNSGVVVEDGVAYAAAGIIDTNGTCVYALDAITGNVKWQNSTCGRVNEETNKGVSAAGNLAIHDGKLLLAGGNEISPAMFDLATGKLLNTVKLEGRPQANRGAEVMVFREKYVLSGGKPLYGPVDRMISKQGFQMTGPDRSFMLLPGYCPPAFDDKTFVCMNDSRGPICCDAEKVEALYADVRGRAGRFAESMYAVSRLDEQGKRWEDKRTQGGTVALALTANMVVAAAIVPPGTGKPVLVAFDLKDGKVVWQQDLPGRALVGGLTVDREGRVMVSLAGGGVVCYGALTKGSLNAAASANVPSAGSD